MKLLRSVFIGMIVVGMIACFSSVSCAEKEHEVWKERAAAKIKLYNEAAAALQEANPALAKEMKARAVEEANEMQVKEERMKSKIKLFQDSAAALKTSNPDLSKKLSEEAELIEEALGKLSSGEYR